MTEQSGRGPPELSVSVVSSSRPMWHGDGVTENKPKKAQRETPHCSKIPAATDMFRGRGLMRSSTVNLCALVRLALRYRALPPRSYRGKEFSGVSLLSNDF